MSITYRQSPEPVWIEGSAFCPCGGELEFLTTCGHSIEKDDSGRVIAFAHPMDGDSKVYCKDCEEEFALDIDAVLEEGDNE